MAINYISKIKLPNNQEYLIKAEYASTSTTQDKLDKSDKIATTAFVHSIFSAQMIGPESSTDGDIVVFDGTDGNVVKDTGISASKIILEGDSRLTNSRNPNAHTHGNISNTGAIGSTSGYAIVTGANGVLTTVNLATEEPLDDETVSTTFIDTIKQASNGKITATKKTMPSLASFVSGPSSSTDNYVVVFSGTGGKTIKSGGILASNIIVEGDSRLTNARTPTSHTHGSITNDGKIGTANGRAVVTTTGGALTTADLSFDSPAASSTTSTTFIDTISQGSNGQITATKKTIPSLASYVTGPSSATTGNIVLFDGTTGKIVKDSGILGSNIVLTSDSRLSDARTPTSHTHGSITNAGAIGTTSGRVVVTGTSGVLTTASLAFVDPTASTTTSTTFIDSISQAANGQISATKKTLPAYVTGPSSATSGRIATFSGTTGKVIQDSGYTTSSFASSGHTHSDYVTGPSSATSGRIATFSGTTGKVIQDSGYTTSSFVSTSDSRLSDARTPTSHSHGNITNAGAIGTTSGYAIVTTTNGVLTTASLSFADPNSSGTSTTFISSISQNSAGQITATKAGLPTYVSTPSTNSNYPVLFKNSTSTTTTAAGDRFDSSAFYFNPYTDTLYATNYSGNGSSLSYVSRCTVSSTQPSTKYTGDLWYEIK